jgi:hypothetical protein
MSLFHDDNDLPSAPLPTITNKYELFNFLNLLCGEHTIGVLNGEEEITAPISPEVRAFLMGKLGHHFRSNVTSMAYRSFPAYSAFFRSIADGLDELLAERERTLSKHGIQAKL